MHLVSNVILQAFFFVIFVAITAFFASGGHGTYAPYAILFGPFSIPFFLIAFIFMSLINNGQGGDLFLLLIMLLFLLSLLQPVVYGFLWKKFLRNSNVKKSSIILPAIHSIGVVPGLLFCVVEDFHRVESSTLALSYIISFVVIGVYWFIFFQLIRRRSDTVKKDAVLRS